MQLLTFHHAQSFFSMTFFDWNAGPGEPKTHMLWIYFAAALPLTLVVVIIWLLCTRPSREQIGRWWREIRKPDGGMEKLKV